MRHSWEEYQHEGKQCFSSKCNALVLSKSYIYEISSSEGHSFVCACTYLEASCLIMSSMHA